MPHLRTVRADRLSTLNPDSYRVIGTVFAALCCMPYVGIPFLEIPSQIQPWAALLGWCFGAIVSFRYGIMVPLRAWALLGLAVVFMIYVPSWSSINLDYYVRKSSAYVLSFGVLLGALYIKPAHMWAALRLSLPLWASFGVLGYLSNSTYLALVRPFVPTALGAFGERGVTSLAPEATDYGFTCAFLFLLALMTRTLLREAGKRVSAWPILLAFVCVALSLSGSGYAALVVIAGALLLFGSNKNVSPLHSAGKFSIAIVLICISFVLLQYQSVTGIRGFDVIIAAAQDPSSLLQGTASYRIAHILVGFYGSIDSWFLGAGAGSFISDGPQIYQRHNIGGLLGLTGWYALNVPVTLSLSPLALFPVIIYEYGVLGVIFILTFFLAIRDGGVPYKAAFIAMYIMTWAQGFPAAYPLLWLIVGLSMNRAFSLAFVVQMRSRRFKDATR